MKKYNFKSDLLDHLSNPDTYPDKKLQEVDRYIVEVYEPSLKQNKRFLLHCLLGEGQSGKTTFVAIFGEYLINKDSNVVYTCTNPSIELLNQNKRRLETIMPVKKISELDKMELIPHQKLLNVFLDEDDFGGGPDSQLSKFQNRAADIPGLNINLFYAGATPFCLVDAANTKDLPITFFKIDNDEGYRGPIQIKTSTKFFDNKNYPNENDVLPLLKKSYNEDKIGHSWIRVKDHTQKSADKFASTLQKEFKHDKPVIIKTVHGGNPVDILSQINEVLRLSKHNYVIAVIVGALKSGFDFESFKDTVRLVYEPLTQEASNLQGLVIRPCGYTTNEPYIIGSKNAIDSYESIYNRSEDFIPNKNSSTHIVSKRKQKETYIGIILEVLPFSDKGLKNYLKGCKLTSGDYTITKASLHTTKQDEFFDKFNRVEDVYNTGGELEDYFGIHPEGSTDINKPFTIMVDDIKTYKIIVVVLMKLERINDKL